MQNLNNLNKFLSDMLQKKYGSHPLALHFGPDLVIGVLSGLDVSAQSQDLEYISSQLTSTLLTPETGVANFLREMAGRAATDDPFNEVCGYVDLLSVFYCACFVKANHFSYLSGRSALDQVFQNCSFPPEIENQVLLHFNSNFTLAFQRIKDDDLINGCNLLTDLSSAILGLRQAGNDLNRSYKTGMITARDSYQAYYEVILDMIPFLK